MSMLLPGGTLISGEDGRWGTAWGHFALPLVAIDPGVNPENVPTNFALFQNHPNPFNPTTVISWQLAISSPVNLSVFNLTGQRVVVLVNETQPAGNHQIEFEASSLASGVYLYRLESKDFIETKRMILMR